MKGKRHIITLAAFLSLALAAGAQNKVGKATVPVADGRSHAVIVVADSTGNVIFPLALDEKPAGHKVQTAAMTSTSAVALPSAYAATISAALTDAGSQSSAAVPMIGGQSLQAAMAQPAPNAERARELIAQPLATTVNVTGFLPATNQTAYLPSQKQPAQPVQQQVVQQPAQTAQHLIAQQAAPHQPAVPASQPVQAKQPVQQPAQASSLQLAAQQPSVQKTSQPVQQQIAQQPAQAAISVQPTQPRQQQIAQQPAQPAEQPSPQQPARPAQAQQPAQQQIAQQPSVQKTSQPVQQQIAQQPAQAAISVQPTQPRQQQIAQQPAQPVQPAQQPSVQKTSQPVQQPAQQQIAQQPSVQKAAQPVQPAQPSQARQSVQPAQPTQPHTAIAEQVEQPRRQNRAYQTVQLERPKQTVQGVYSAQYAKQTKQTAAKPTTNHTRTVYPPDSTRLSNQFANAEKFLKDDYNPLLRNDVVLSRTARQMLEFALSDNSLEEVRNRAATTSSEVAARMAAYKAIGEYDADRKHAESERTQIENLIEQFDYAPQPETNQQELSPATSGEGVYTEHSRKFIEIPGTQLIMPRPASATDNDAIIFVNVNFRKGNHVLDPGYMGNAENLARYSAAIDSIGLWRIVSVEIVSQSSPDGSLEKNTWLSYLRAAAMEKYITERHPELVKLLTINSDGESWDQLRAYVARDKKLSTGTVNHILSIIDSKVDEKEKKQMLRSNLGDDPGVGDVYSYLTSTYYDLIRNSAIFVMYDKDADYRRAPGIH